MYTLGIYSLTTSRFVPVSSASCRIIIASIRRSASWGVVRVAERAGRVGGAGGGAGRADDAGGLGYAL